MGIMVAEIRDAQAWVEACGWVAEAHLWVPGGITGIDKSGVETFKLMLQRGLGVGPHGQANNALDLIADFRCGVFPKTKYKHNIFLESIYTLDKQTPIIDTLFNVDSLASTQEFELAVEQLYDMMVNGLLGLNKRLGIAYTAPVFKSSDTLTVKLKQLPQALKPVCLQFTNTLDYILNPQYEGVKGKLRWGRDLLGGRWGVVAMTVGMAFVAMGIAGMIKSFIPYGLPYVFLSVGMVIVPATLLFRSWTDVYANATRYSSLLSYTHMAPGHHNDQELTLSHEYQSNLVLKEKSSQISSHTSLRSSSDVNMMQKSDRDSDASLLQSPQVELF